MIISKPFSRPLYSFSASKAQFKDSVLRTSLVLVTSPLSEDLRVVPIYEKIYYLDISIFSNLSGWASVCLLAEVLYYIELRLIAL